MSEANSELDEWTGEEAVSESANGSLQRRDRMAAAPAGGRRAAAQTRSNSSQPKEELSINMLSTT